MGSFPDVVVFCRHGLICALALVRLCVDESILSARLSSTTGGQWPAVLPCLGMVCTQKTTCGARSRKAVAPYRVPEMRKPRLSLPCTDLQHASVQRDAHSSLRAEERTPRS